LVLGRLCSGSGKRFNTEITEQARRARSVGDDDLGRAIIGCALKVHRTLGPGLLESVYETCLAHELQKSGIACERQVPLPVVYDGMTIDQGYRIDLLVAGRVVVEVKSIEAVADVHRAQLLSYLRLGDYRLGYLLNFNVALMKTGIVRRVNGYEREAPQ
jgi:GxxExxY protein